MSNVIITTLFWHILCFEWKQTYISMWSDLSTYYDWSYKQCLMVWSLNIKTLTLNRVQKYLNMFDLHENEVPYCICSRETVLTLAISDRHTTRQTDGAGNNNTLPPPNKNCKHVSTWPIIPYLLSYKCHLYYKRWLSSLPAATVSHTHGCTHLYLLSLWDVLFAQAQTLRYRRAQHKNCHS